MQLLLQLRVFFYPGRDIDCLILKRLKELDGLSLTFPFAIRMGTPKEISARQDEQIDTEKKAGINQAVEETNDDLVSEEKNLENFQNGVQRVKAITSVWSTKTMVLMFIP